MTLRGSYFEFTQHLELIIMRLLVALLLVVISLVNGFSLVPLDRSSLLRASDSKLHMTILTYKGKKKDFKAGSPLKVAVKQLGVPVKYSCNK
jgi:hypothetical protein